MVTGQHLAVLGGKKFSDSAIYEVFMALILKQHPDAGQTHCIFACPNDTGRKYKQMPTEVSLFLTEMKSSFSPINLDRQCPFPQSLLSVDEYYHEKSSLSLISNFTNASMSQLPHL